MRHVGSLLSVLLLAAGNPEQSQTSSFQYQRPVSAAGSGQVCAVIDPAIFAHAAPALRDLRLVSSVPSGVEVPYILTLSEAQQTETEIGHIVDLTHGKGEISFDLTMPARAYTDVILNLDGQDFIATADVTGRRVPHGPADASLGHFTLFDLSTRHLSRSTTLHLQESIFPVLHVRLHLWKEGHGQPLTLTAEQASRFVRGASVPPSRERQAFFDTALRSPVQTTGPSSVAHFLLPQHVPIERVQIQLASGPVANFSRTVHVAARPIGSDTEEVASGIIARTHLNEAGQELRQDQMTLNATLGANLQSAAEVQVSVTNGDKAPLPIASIALQVRQRKLCFHAGPAPLTLFYGDSDLHLPQAAGGADFSPAAPTAEASIGPESPNPAWRPQLSQPAPRQQPHHLVWIILLGLAGLFGTAAIRSKRIVHHER